MVEQIMNLLKNISIEKMQNMISLKPDLDKFMVINNELDNPAEIDIQKFIRYIFNQGIKDQKRDLIGCLEMDIYLKDKQIVIRK